MVLSKKGNDIISGIGKFVKDAFFTILVCALIIFILGQIYAIYFGVVRNSQMFWLPVYLLMLILAAKVIQK